MASKEFGVKKFNSINSSGVSKIESPNNLNIDALTVGISTDLNVGNNLTVNGNAELNDVNVVGIITADSVSVGGANTITVNLNGGLLLDGKTIQGRPQNVFNVMDYGATANGATDDTTAFNNAIQAAGSYGSVYAPPGNYKVNGIVINGDGQNITIDGRLIVGPNETAIIFDKPSGLSTQYCRLYVKEIFHSVGSIGRPTDSSTGIYFRNGSFNTVEFGRIGYLNYAVVIDPSTKTPTQGLTSDNRIKGNLIDFCRYGVYSNGGSDVLNHTEHTTIEINFIAHYQYGIYKTNSVGSQKFWYVNTAFDAFPETNPDYAADVFDDYVQSNDDNLSSCWYQCYLSTDDAAFKGNAFNNGRNCFLFDVTRRRTHFGERIRMDTYLGEIELEGPSNLPEAGGIVLTSNNGTKYRVYVTNAGTLQTTTTRYTPNYTY